MFSRNSSACLFKDGNLLAAAEEERLEELNIGQVFHQSQLDGVYLKLVLTEDVDVLQ